MGTGLGFAYCHARIQARLAALPSEQEWDRLAGARTLAGFIEEARTGPLCPWLKGFSTLSDAHAIERGLRALVGDLVQEIAGWVPQRWRGAVDWVAWLPSLPMLTEMARGGPMPSWLVQDYALQGLLSASGEPDAEAVASAGLAELLAAGDAQAVAERWLAEWHRRCAHAGAGARRELDRLASRLRSHLAVFRAADPDQAWVLRRALREDLWLLFHRRPLQPVAVFCYLVLVLLDLERLRSALIGRALFAQGGQV